MAPHGSLKASHEAISTRLSPPNSGRTTLMMTLVTGLFATGMLALSLESLGVTAACFGIAMLMLRFA
jgi:hypothetical protein